MKKGFLIICALLLSIQTFSQSSIGTTLNLTGYSQQQYFNNTSTIPGYITNTGNQLINDTIMMYCGVQDSAGAITLISYTNLNMVTLQSNDTANFSITIPVSPNNFRLGNNIVVVWPVTSSPAMMVDSVFISCDVVGYTSMNVLDNKLKKAYPNPFKDQITLSDVTLKQVRIFNSLGQTFILPVINGVVNFDERFKSGLYVIDLNGTFIRLVKE